MLPDWLLNPLEFPKMDVAEPDNVSSVVIGAEKWLYGVMLPNWLLNRLEFPEIDVAEPDGVSIVVTRVPNFLYRVMLPGYCKSGSRIR